MWNSFRTVDTNEIFWFAAKNSIPKLMPIEWIQQLQMVFISIFNSIKGLQIFFFLWDYCTVLMIEISLHFSLYFCRRHLLLLSYCSVMKHRKCSIIVLQKQNGLIINKKWALLVLVELTDKREIVDFFFFRESELFINQFWKWENLYWLLKRW